MDNQDWKPIVFKKSNSKINNTNNTKKTKVLRSSKNNSSLVGTGKKISDDDVIVKIDYVGSVIGNQIAKARIDKNWKQKDLATRMNLQLQIVQQHENGKAIRNNSMLVKFERILGTKLKR